MQRLLLIYIFLLTNILHAAAQDELLAPVGYRPQVQAEGKYHKSVPRAAAKTTVLSLPFFEDFTDDDFFPDTVKWVDRKVYINNNMGNAAVSRGVATFDAIDENGLPYEKVVKGLIRYADSLTSRTFDLSTYTAADSIYLSFFYQPQGNGFDPQPDDSLMLYFRRTNTSSPWTRVWRVAGTTLRPFTQVMVPITDVNYFHSDFQFRFVNKASINNTDDNWHIDYIRLDANRNMNDTALAEVAYIAEPTFILKDYSYMPYHQYMADAAAERAAQHETSIRNNNSNTVNVNFGYQAREVFSNTFLSNGNSNINIAPQTEQGISFPVYTNTVTAPAKHSAVTFENKYYLQATTGSGTTDNDTIVRLQHFHNYLAYDDGTAEKSYYLNMFSTLPGKIAVKYKLNEPDTLKGIAIYFGRQVPLAYQKYFSVSVYRDIAYGGGNEVLLYQEDFFTPAYLQQNSFWYYKFEKPVVLPAGTFYIGTIQPALGSSDSLYIGLDVHRTADNHLFYNVLNEWKASSISGAVMMRPLFGDFYPSVVSGPATRPAYRWDVIPNPATDRIRFSYQTYDGKADYTIADMQGRTLRSGTVTGADWVDISDLTPGVYMVNFSVDGENTTPRKIIKM